MAGMNGERRPGGWWRGARAALCLAAAALAAAGCDGGGEAREAELALARTSLADDPSAALALARKGLAEANERGEPLDPRLLLVAAEACLRLDRRNDALQHATDALTAPDLDDDLKADLCWARGAALMGRYNELGDESDWRAANSTLERATEAGRHRLEAAMLLVGLQDLGNHSNPERQLKYARQVIALDTEGSKATLVKRLLEAKGLTP
jgi:hypothetical protein